MSTRDPRIVLMLLDAIDDDGYLRESLGVIAQSLLPEIRCSADEVLPVLHQVQRLDPVGVGARDLGECLVLQLDNLPDDTPGRVLARRIAIDHIDRLPRIGIEGVASELHCDLEQAEQALALLDRSEEHTSELQSLMRISYAVFCLKINRVTNNTTT